MGYKTNGYEKSILENIKQYTINDLIDQSKIMDSFFKPAEAFGIKILMTQRHGEVFLSSLEVDENNLKENAKDEKIRVQNRTVAHVYADFTAVDNGNIEPVKNWYQSMLFTLTEWMQEVYLRKEAENYIFEFEVDNIDRQNDKMDSLTGVFNKNYFLNRLNVIERSEIVPVALIEANINDTKFFFDNYGESAGNRLLCLVADALKQCAKKEYIIGRWGVDVFHILIPLPEENEAEGYCERVKAVVSAFEDNVLAPSVAMGIVYKTNVEEKFNEKLSDLQFEMLSDKMRMKQQPEYEINKRKGLH